MTPPIGMPAAIRRSSDLSKHSAEVFAEAEDHPVTVTRRDGEPLVLMSQREAEGRQQLLHLAAALITVALEDGPLAQNMSAQYPWMFALNEDDRARCAQDLLDAARASFATSQPHLAIAKLTSWHETATAIASGFDEVSVEWLDSDAESDSMIVDRP